MNHPRLARIVANLRRYVPPPPAAIARPAASFATLRVGQRITDTMVEATVLAVDSLGATLQVGDSPRVRLTDRNWKATWSRVRPPRKRKETT